jgi:hypothetical protein
MFGKVLNKLFRRGATPAKSAPVVKSSAPVAASSPFARTVAPEPSAPPPSKQASAAPATAAAASAASTAAETKAADSVKQEWLSKSSKRINSADTPETLCGVNKSMPKEEIREKLAVLYRRHNRAASSLDAQLRDEAETMLEAIATVKERLL